MAKEKDTTNRDGSTSRSETTTLAKADLAYLQSLKADRDAANETYEQATRALEESDLFKAKEEAELEFQQDDQAWQHAEQALRKRYRMHPKDKIDLETGQITRIDPEAYDQGVSDLAQKMQLAKRR